MKISVGILTHNAISGMRLDLLEQTLASIEVAFPGCEYVLLDNGSTDGTWDFVNDLWKGRFGITAPEQPYRYHLVKRLKGDTSPGTGNKTLGKHLALTGADILVMSDDDMIWKPGAAETLKRFWSIDPAATNPTVRPPGTNPPVTVLCGYLEPDWAWNTPESVVEVNGVRVLVRASAPTCAWTFRAKDWPLLESLMPDGFGHDYKTCMALRALRSTFHRCEDCTALGVDDPDCDYCRTDYGPHKIAQIDLAEHAGWGRSSHGNEAITMAKPLDRVKWGI